jgi:hypothetical protein
MIIALLLRGLLATFNREANDDHVGVIRVIAYENRIPAAGELWESFQPKLYHLTVAGPLRLLPMLSHRNQYVAAQFVSCAAGVLTILIVYLCLASLSLSVGVRVVTFALIALAPDMVSASAQATNDAFVILFSSLALGAASRFFQVPSWWWFSGMTIAAILAALSKGNGLVVALVIALVLGVAVVRPPADGRLLRGRSLTCLTAFLFLFGTTAPVLGGYVNNYTRTGTPFATNVPRPDPPPWVIPTYPVRPGVTSVVSGFFTFRLIGLLQDPITRLEPRNYPLHRTSLWSQLYGRMHFGHFAAWPPTWASRREGVRWLGRATLLVALIPTLVLVVGLGRSVGKAVRWLGRNDDAGFGFLEVLLLVAAFGHLGFIAAYAYLYRDFAVMKSVFVAPGVLAFAVVFAHELEFLSGHRRRVAIGAGGVLCGLYAVDAALIVVTLLYRALR